MLEGHGANLREQPQRAEPYYRHDLALVHHRGFGFHATACAPGILALLEPVRARGGLIVEIGCGTGLLTRHLLDAGLRVLATDASPAMLEIARDELGDAVEEWRVVRLPEDPLPSAAAFVGVGHPLNYLDDRRAFDEALRALAVALEPDGVLATDVCDLEWGAQRVDAPAAARVGDDWAIITRFSVPEATRFVREITSFVANGDGTWRRDDEHHENVLVDTSQLPLLLDGRGVEATVRASFGNEVLPRGLRALVGKKRFAPTHEPSGDAPP